MAAVKGVEYAKLSDEIITDIKAGIEKFVESEGYWAKFAHVAPVDRGAKTFSFRRLVKPMVRAEDVKPRAEYIAPRPTKIAVQTFEKTVEIYSEKFIYSKEDMVYHFDDTVNNGRATLQEKVRQIKEFIYGKPFVNSAATVSYETSLINTLDKAAIILRKNEAKRWDGVHYLAHITPEVLKALRAEIRALGSSISEPTKKDLDGNVVGEWGDWLFSVTTSPIMYKDDTHQYLVLMGKRGIDGNSPIDISKMKGESDLEVFDNGLGSGVLVDVDGNYTADDNHQQGSIAININCVGAAVNDDLCVLDCTIDTSTVTAAAEISKTVLNAAELTGYHSNSPTSSLTISVVQAADPETSIASPTITVKKKNSGGSSVSAVDGAYPVVPGDQYYISVAKADYTTVTISKFVAAPGDNTLVVAMASA